jgi:hypothetical protein
MQFLRIGVNGDGSAVAQQIKNELQQLEGTKINFTIDEINSDGATSIICRINDGKLYRKNPS